ncbi:hypothetical protein U1Q18_021006, partial [Sarracenia purpurea var. burkii]
MNVLKSILTCGNSRFTRVQDEMEPGISPSEKHEDGLVIKERCSKGQVLSRVFAEDYQGAGGSILDPRSAVARRWNELFLAAGVFSLFIDPLFLFLPRINPAACIETEPTQLQVILTALRSVTDLFYVINMIVQFRTAYVAASSRVIGRGELVIDPGKIAGRYLRQGFWFDLLASLPFPQVMTWLILPNVTGSATAHSKIVLRFIPISQYLLRLFLLYPLSSKIIKNTGKMAETAWVGAAYNMLLYYIASNLAGPCWYLLTMERQEACWKSACDLE